MTLAQQHQLPYEPSLFSPEVRVGLVQHGLNLQDESGSVKVEFDLDPSGLSEGQGIVLLKPAASAVADVIVEIQEIVDQIEEKRVI